jgi:hypothetical protein
MFRWLMVVGAAIRGDRCCATLPTAPELVEEHQVMTYLEVYQPGWVLELLALCDLLT